MTPSAVRPEVQSALAGLHHSDLDRRSSALDALKALTKEGLSSGEASALLLDSFASHPPARFPGSWSFGEELLVLLRGRLGDEHLPPIASEYPRIPSAKQAAVLSALATVQTAEATRLYVELLLRHGWPRGGYPAIVGGYEEAASFAAEVLPAFVEGRVRGLPTDVLASLLLGYGNAGRLPLAIGGRARGVIAGRAEELVARSESFARWNRRSWQRWARRLLRGERPGPFLRPPGSPELAWRFHEDYGDERADAGLYLDVLGHLGRDEQLLTVLRRAERLVDPRPRTFAITSLLRLGEVPDEAAVRAVAGDGETRALLWEQLAVLNRSDVFPASEREQARLAESVLVRWLCHGAELGQAPEHIELMKAVEEDAGEEGGGLYVHYVFRFRTDPPHWGAEKGWLLGVAGPFRKAEFPTTRAWGDTFSTFEPWDSATAEEYVVKVETLMLEWQRAQKLPEGPAPE